MGKVRGKSIKRAARKVTESYFCRINRDFENNLAVVKDVVVAQNQTTKNQIAGYVTHLYNRILKGSVKGISIKSYEQERERKESFIPQKGILDVEKVMVDAVTANMIRQYKIQGNYGVYETDIKKE